MTPIPPSMPATPDPERALETPRLVLEPLTPAHAPALYPSLRDDRLYRFIPTDPPTSPTALATRYRRLATRRSPDGREAWLNWAMRRRNPPGPYVGTLEATVLPDRSAVIAYLVFVPDQRRGYAREGVAALLDHLLRDHPLDLIAAEVDTRNAASIALLAALGFARVATTRGADHFKGAPSDEHRYELRRPPASTLAPRQVVRSSSPASTPQLRETRKAPSPRIGRGRVGG